MKKIKYFEDSGEENTKKTIQLAKERALELEIEDIVIASTYGKTAKKALELFNNDFNLVVVTISNAFEEEGWLMDDEVRKEIEEKGAKVLTCPHTLSAGIGDSFENSISPEKIVTETLYRFSQGMKVCVEIVMMASDSGIINVDEETLAIAGTDRGADTCIVLNPSYSRKFTDLEIKEIVALPR